LFKQIVAGKETFTFIYLFSCWNSSK